MPDSAVDFEAPHFKLRTWYQQVGKLIQCVVNGIELRSAFRSDGDEVLIHRDLVPDGMLSDFLASIA